MMNLNQLLTDLRAQDIEITAAAGKLKINAPKGAMTPGLETQLRLHKQELLGLLMPPQLPIFAPAPPARWVLFEVAADVAKFDPEAWPLSLYCEQTQQWVEFATPADLQAAALEDTRLKLPEPSAWRGGKG